MEYKNDRTANRRRYKSRYHSPHNYKTKRSKSENRAAILIGIATFIVLASLILVFTFGDNIFKFLDDTFHPSPIISEKSSDNADASIGAIATVAPTQSPTEAQTEAPTDAVPQSADFNRLLTAAGLKAADLTGSQLILVESSGTSAVVYTYEKDTGGVWNQKFEPMQGFVGEGGCAADSVPYDSVTPKGLYNIEFAMGTNPNPGTALSYNEITYGMRWVTDPASVNYNRLVDGDATVIDFNDCQDLYEYTRSYPYAVIYDYNRNPVSSTKGSAKFLHVAYAPTYGGVGIAESDLYNIMLWLNPANAPQIAVY